LEAVSQLINLPLLLSSAIGFGIMFWVLKKFLWAPVLGVIDERKESIEAAFAEVDQAREEVAQLKTEYEAKLKQINAEAQAKLQEAIDRGNQAADELRAAAEESREKLLQKTHEDIAREKEKAIAELRNQAVDLSFAIARRVTRDGLDREHHDKLVQSFIGELKELN
jgi:F-type H+-transporting ATPase subunit b